MPCILSMRHAIPFWYPGSVSLDSVSTDTAGLTVCCTLRILDMSIAGLAAQEFRIANSLSVRLTRVQAFDLNFELGAAAGAADDHLLRFSGLLEMPDVSKSRRMR